MSILPIDQVPEMMGGAENQIVAVLVRTKGDIEGGVLFTVDIQSANNY